MFLAESFIHFLIPYIGSLKLLGVVIILNNFLKWAPSSISEGDISEKSLILSLSQI
jgi:hypothetical protein